MRQVHFLTHLSFVLLWNEFQEKGRVNWRIHIRDKMLEFAQNWTTVNVMKQMVKIIGLVREPSVIQKDVLQALKLLCFRCNSNRRFLSCISRAIVGKLSTVHLHVAISRIETLNVSMTQPI